MSKKKLAIVNTEPMDFAYGGVCPIIRNMHPVMSREFDADYFYLDESAAKGSLIPRRLKMLLYVRRKRKVLSKYDFILSHIPEGSYAVSKLGVPYAHIYHGNTNPMTGSRHWYGKYFYFIFERFFRRISRTASLRYTVGQPWEGVKKLYNPVRHDIKPTDCASRHGFIYAGRLENGKNIDRIIRIYMSLTPEERDQNPLTIAGTGTLETSLKTLASELGGDTCITFTGMLSNPELVKLDSEQKILLMASSFEGFPTAIAEALTVGVPVVTTGVGDIPAVIKDGVNGRLMPEGYSDDNYIGAIRDVLANYESYSEQALETGKIFDADKITLAVAQDIKNYLDGNGRKN